MFILKSYIVQIFSDKQMYISTNPSCTEISYKNMTITCTVKTKEKGLTKTLKYYTMRKHMEFQGNSKGVNFNVTNE